MRPKRLMTATVAIGALCVLAPSAGAHGGQYEPAGRKAKPATIKSYINRDTGLETENSSVRKGSKCEKPDRRDRQKLSEEGETDRNVHNDACLFTRKGKAFDGPVTFVVRGPGYISTCPDPDLTSMVPTPATDGPKEAKPVDKDGDGRAEACRQTGYQEKDAAGDFEYHVRTNNDSEPGRSKVVFCYDRDQNGCFDEKLRKAIYIKWVNG